MKDENDEGIDMNLLTGLFDAPAYVRRARNVEQALEYLLAKEGAARDEMLEMPRLRVGVLLALAGEWSALRPWLADDAQVVLLESLHRTLTPRLRLPPERTRSSRALERALSELIESIGRFNQRWADHARKIDLAPLNEMRQAYNRYFVLEKACAVRNEAVARAGFTPLPPLDLAELLRLLPLLPVPRLA